MTPLPIDDPDDPRLAAYTRMRERDLVGREGRFIAEGEVVLRVLLSGAARFRIESVLLAPERWPGLAPALARLDAPVYLAAKAVMGAVAGFPIHRGVLAVGLRGDDPAPDALVPAGPALLVGLVGLANHDNVGGIFPQRRRLRGRRGAARRRDLRSALPQGDPGLGRDEPHGPLRTPPHRLRPPGSLRAPRADAVALSPRGEDITTLPPLPRALLLLGTEGPGLPEALMARAPRVAIPMAPGVDSLNVAVAGAVALHRLGGGRLTSAR